MNGLTVQLLLLPYSDRVDDSRYIETELLSICGLNKSHFTRHTMKKLQNLLFFILSQITCSLNLFSIETKQTSLYCYTHVCMYIFLCLTHWHFIHIHLILHPLLSQTASKHENYTRHSGKHPVQKH